MPWSADEWEPGWNKVYYNKGKKAKQGGGRGAGGGGGFSRRYYSSYIKPWTCSECGTKHWLGATRCRNQLCASHAELGGQPSQLQAVAKGGRGVLPPPPQIADL
eukprot:11224291-Alexandrium_andersonii.AAC.1